MNKYKHDIILICTILAVGIIGALALKLTQKSGKTVRVIIDGETKYTYSLSNEINKDILQGENRNTLVISNGYAFVEQASCPDKICVLHRKISKTGETIVCLPNKLVIEVE